MKTQSDRPQTTVITVRQQELIREAMAVANPDEDGSLMRELDARGVGEIVRKFKEAHHEA